jgi:hypothetical protein
LLKIGRIRWAARAKKNISKTTLSEEKNDDLRGENAEQHG